MFARTTALALSFVLATAAAAQAATLRFTAALNGASEVPANTETGTGEVSAMLDTSTKVITYTATYSGLTGPGVAAHFHGPAAPGSNAGPVVMIANPASPITGTATLTDAQIEELKAGSWYFNVHTAAHKGGEIRGQLKIMP